MATGIAFLQAELDEPPANHGTYQAGNTDMIRQMLREQQRSMGALHANALFREFRGDKKAKHGKGNAASSMQIDNLMPIDDFQAEGQARLQDLIRSTALKDEKPLRGVWASFGKPYMCLGDPKEPIGKLPALYRDELAAIEKAKSDKKNGKQSRKQLPLAPPGPDGLAAETGQRSSLNGLGQGPPGTAGSRSGSRGGSRNGSARRIGTANSMASLEGLLKPEEVLELRLNKIKNVMRFGNSDVTEATFPMGPLYQSGQRRKRSQVRPGSFVDPTAASHEVTDPYLAYGQPPLPVRNLKVPTLRKKANNRRQQNDDDVAPGNTFITQQGESTGTGKAPSDNGSQKGDRTSASQTITLESAGDDGTRPGSSDVGDQGLGMSPIFQPIVPPAVPMRGDEDNPVYAWHNHFLQVRHEGRAALQAALFQRAEGRFRARTVGPMAANLSSLLMADLSQVKGKQLPYARAGVAPASPYSKMDISWVALQERAAAAARAASTLDPEELLLLQRFYDQLCALVEAQRMSDPLLLMVVHQVKQLLEEGTFLQRTMFESVVKHVAGFVGSTGLKKYNKFLLSVFTFIAKCTGVNEVDFDNLIRDAGLSIVVYNQPEPPSHTQAAQAAHEEAVNAQRMPRQSRAKSISVAASKAQSQAVRKSSVRAPSISPGVSGPESSRSQVTDMTKIQALQEETEEDMAEATPSGLPAALQHFAIEEHVEDGEDIPAIGS